MCVNSHLHRYNTVAATTPGVTPERRARWLQIAESGAKFLEKHGRNEEGA